MRCRLRTKVAVVDDQEGTGLLPGRSVERNPQVGGISHRKRLKLHPQSRRRFLEPLQGPGPDRIVGIPEDSHPGDRGDGFLQQLQILQLQLVGEDREAGEVAARLVPDSRPSPSGQGHH